VREHFGEKLRQQNPAAWKEAHSRLYEYYKKLPAKELPDSLEEMEPLFAAVAHGCQAERYEEVYYHVYFERIRRKTKYYVTDKLGAFGSNLAALSNFFEISWSQPVPSLSDSCKAAVLNNAGFDLRALGRLREATQPMKASLNAHIRQRHWREAAKDSGNLSELNLIMGEIKLAVDYARQSINFADRSGDDSQSCDKRTTLADALHQAGELQETENLLRKAEAMQKKSALNRPYLYSLRGFRFCDLLLSQGQYQEVQKRFKKVVEWRLPSDSLLSIALENLSAGRAFLLQATDRPLAATGQYFDQARDYLQQAVAGLRESGREDILPRGLLARAAFYRSQNEFALAWADLEEAQEIAERGEMKLFLADYHLEAGRLVLAEGGGQGAEGVERRAKEHLNIAAKMIEDMGYGRRRPEVEELHKQLES
jgi:tetratricopeptide (TPR) repeat protein